MEVTESGFMWQNELKLFFVTFVAAYFAVKRWKENKRRSLDIPGPRGWPILGNVPQMNGQAHKKFMEWTKQYGPVFKINLFTRPVLVINGYEAIRQALVRQADEFAGRPEFFAFKLVDYGKNLGMGSWDERWELHRKLANRATRMFIDNKNARAEMVMASEATHMVEDFIQMSDDGRDSFDPESAIRMAIMCNIHRLTFGREMDARNDPIIQKYFNDVEEIFANFVTPTNPINSIPALRFILREKFRKYLQYLRGTEQMVFDRVEEREKTLKKGKIRDVMDAFLTVSEKLTGQEETFLGGKEVFYLTTKDFLQAGYHTTTLYINWALVYLVNNPEIQEKVIAEVRKVTGSDRHPEIRDRSQMPYTRAFLLEVARHSHFTTLAIPHATTRDTALMGHRVPKGTFVMVNLWSTSRDETMWPEPEEFRPQRFLTPDGTELQRGLEEQVFLFGIGKRRCLGDQIGKHTVFIFITSLLQKCRVKLPVRGQPLNIETTSGIGLMIKPYQIRVEKLET